MQRALSNKGLTIVEVVVAGVLFLAFTIPLMTLLNTSKFNNKLQESKIQAFLLAQNVIEEFQHNSEVYNYNHRKFPYQELPGYSVKTVFKSFDTKHNRTGLLLLEVTVKWKALKKSQQLKLTSLISTTPSFYKFPRSRRLR